jgi:hypothetical protein
MCATCCELCLQAQRLYPVAPFVVRHITKDLIVKGSGTQQSDTLLPKGVLAVVWIYRQASQFTRHVHYAMLRSYTVCYTAATALESVVLATAYTAVF